MTLGATGSQCRSGRSTARKELQGNTGAWAGISSQCPEEPPRGKISVLPLTSSLVMSLSMYRKPVALLPSRQTLHSPHCRWTASASLRVPLLSGSLVGDNDRRNWAGSVFAPVRTRVCADETLGAVPYSIVVITTPRAWEPITVG